MPFARNTPTPPEEGDDLLRRFLAGEASAHRVVERWAREIVRFRPYGIPSYEHDDIVQQSVGMLWKACAKPDFALHLGLRAFLRRIVMARCVDALRRRRPSEELADEYADPAAGPEESLIEAGRWTEVQWALRQLNEKCREVIRLHYLEELPYADLAARMGIAPATARVRMFNCMKEVRRLLDAEGADVRANDA